MVLIDQRLTNFAVEASTERTRVLARHFYYNKLRLKVTAEDRANNTLVSLSNHLVVPLAKSCR